MDLPTEHANACGNHRKQKQQMNLYQLVGLINMKVTSTAPPK